MNRADLRTALPGAYGDDFTYQQALKRVEEARRVQAVRWAVAPGQSVLLVNGIRLGAGSEVTEALMVGALPSPRMRIRLLVEQGFVLEADGFDAGPEAA